MLSFNYLLRADHEQPLLIFALLSILAGLRLESNKWWFWGLFCASGGGFFVKGLASFYIPLFGLFSFIYVSGLQIKKIGLILLSYSSIPLFMGIYELYFHKVTGLPFFSGYWTVQMAQRTLNQDFNLFSKISNLFYYLSRAFLYSLPWSFFAAYFFIKGKKINNQVFKFLFILAMIPILGFSCFNRIASRYVFVSNFLFSVLCIMYVFLNSPWLKNLHQKLLKNVERVTILIWGMLIVLDLCLKEFVSKVL